MTTKQVVAGLMAVGVLGGCAGGQPRSQVAHLESQVGALEERVTQLERASAAAFSPAPLVSQPAEPAASGRGEAAPAADPRASGTATSADAGLSKPSTREIQVALQNAGFYEGPIDGKTGPLTRAAIKEFQLIHGLKDDGVVGKLTWAKLRDFAQAAPSAAAPAGADAGDQTARK